MPPALPVVVYFSNAQWQQLDDAGMITHDLTPDEVARSLALKERHPALSATDSLCFVTALAYHGILLTGDALLRRVAANSGLRVHGVLWIVDELDASRGCAKSLLIQALKTWRDDDAVFLPRHEISKRVEYLGSRTRR